MPCSTTGVLAVLAFDLEQWLDAVGEDRVVPPDRCVELALVELLAGRGSAQPADPAYHQPARTRRFVLLNAV